MSGSKAAHSPYRDSPIKPKPYRVISGYPSLIEKQMEKLDSEGYKFVSMSTSLAIDMGSRCETITVLMKLEANE